jgi:ABC-type polysaccharide/polyol phosphate export permease
MCFNSAIAISPLSILSYIIVTVIFLFIGIFAFNYIDQTFTDTI